MKQLIATVPPLGLVQRKCFQNRKNILFHRHLPKDRFLLRQITHPEPGPFVHGVVCDIGARKNHAAAVWPDQTNDHVKTRGLAGAIRPEESDDLARANMHVHTVHDGATAINLDQFLGGQNSFRFRCDGRMNLGS